MRLLCARGRRI